MEEQIRLLIELQGLDKQIFSLEAELATKPDDIKRMEAEYKEKEEATKEADSELKKIQLVHKDKEIQLKTKEDSIAKLQSQLYQIKTNKEYTAMEHEINGARADCSMLEEEIINLLDQIDEAQKRKTERADLLNAEKGKSEDEKKRIAEESKKIETELNGLKKERGDLAQKTDKTILSKYERILHNKSGQALVPVRNNACQGCFLDMPPQVINEINLREDLVFCESCARILYIEEENGE